MVRMVLLVNTIYIIMRKNKSALHAVEILAERLIIQSLNHG